MNIKAIMNKGKHYFGRNGALAGLLFMLILATCINPSFMTLENLSNVLRQTSMNGIIAIGMAMVLISGSIDLSVGSLYALCGFVGLYFSNYSTGLAIVATLAVGILIGLINGLLVTKMGLHPWIATLSMMLGLRGVTLIVTGENTYFAEQSSASFALIGRGTMFQFINTPTVLFLLIAVIAAIILSRTALGRSAYATGGNLEAARMMGVNTGRTIRIMHIFSGICTAVSGLIVGSRMGAAYPLSGEGGEMYAIAACVIGGVYLMGGRGTIFGTVIGALVVGLLTNIFNMQQALNSFWESVITGSLVLVVVLIQQIQANKLEHRKQRAA